jgi:hypothetical protein
MSVREDSGFCLFLISGGGGADDAEDNKWLPCGPSETIKKSPVRNPNNPTSHVLRLCKKVVVVGILLF